MKKKAYVVLSLALAFVFTSLAWGGSAAEAAAKKEYLEISKNVIYFGQLKNGVPHGKGTITWYATKSYAGDWVNGKRSGVGKYVNRYTNEGKSMLVTYDGEWKNDMKSGNGALTTKITGFDNTVEYHKIQSGTFANDIFSSGFSVAHSDGTEPYSFNYKDAKMNLQIFGTNVNMKQAWKNGDFHAIQYSKGKVIKNYSVDFNENPSRVKENKETLQYLKGIQSDINTHLEKFERLAVRVPLK